MRTKWTAKGNRDAGPSCSCDRGPHRYLAEYLYGILMTLIHTSVTMLTSRHALERKNYHSGGHSWRGGLFKKQLKKMSESCILVKLLRMYFPRNWEFGSALSKLRNLGGGGFEHPKSPPSVRHWLCVFSDRRLSKHHHHLPPPWTRTKYLRMKEEVHTDSIHMDRRQIYTTTYWEIWKAGTIWRTKS